MNASASLQAIRRYVDAHREHLATPGLALAVTDRARCLGVVVDGSANLDASEPVAPHHRFQIGSISKGFTALAVLQEVEAGRIDLDAPVTAYLPWFEVTSAFEPITIHHLLSHTSGLIAGTDFTGDAPSEVWSLRETVTGFAPGERFLYSNVGYKALGLVLEAVTGEPWWRTVRERVMEPIGLGGCDVVITNDVRDRLAVGHRAPFDDRPWLPRHGWAPSPWFESGTADGTICTTAEELTAFARLLLARGASVVSTGSFERMTTPFARDSESGDRFGYGLKWVEDADGPGLLGHSGGMIGFTAYLLVDVEAGVGVSVLMNSPFGRRLDLSQFALSCLRAEGAGEPLPDVGAPRDPKAVDDAVRYAGAYRDVIGTVVVEARSERLVVLDEGRRLPLVAIDEDVFAVDDDVLGIHPMRFVRDAREAGGVTRVLWGPRELTPRGLPVAPDAPAHAWNRYAGRYASWNPWAPGFRVFLRPSGLWLAFTGDALDVESEQRLEPLVGGSFRAADAWSPDRVRFDMVIDGRAHRAVFDAAPFYRTFVP